MDLTPQQKAKVANLKDVYGGAIRRISTRLRSDGCVHVYLTCEAGEWDWSFDEQGELKQAVLTGRLFDAPARLKVRRTQFDPEYSATQTMNRTETKCKECGKWFVAEASSFVICAECGAKDD